MSKTDLWIAGALLGVALGLQAENKVLALAGNLPEFSTDQFRAEIRRALPAQGIGAEDPHVLNAPSRQRRIQFAHNRFHFGQFRHLLSFLQPLGNQPGRAVGRAVSIAFARRIELAATRVSASGVTLKMSS